jgi:hypothetical protein
MLILHALDPPRIEQIPGLPDLLGSHLVAIPMLIEVMLLVEAQRLVEDLKGDKRAAEILRTQKLRFIKWLKPFILFMEEVRLCTIISLSPALRLIPTHDAIVQNNSRCEPHSRFAHLHP